MARTFVAASSHVLEYAGAVLTAAPLTLSVRYRPTNFAGNTNLLSLSNNASDSFFTLQVLTTAVARANEYDGATIGLAVSPGTLTAGVWSHVAAVFASNANRTIYLDGTGTNNTTGSPSPTGINRTTVGSYYITAAHSDFANGDLAEIAIWNIALAAIDLSILALGVSPLLVRPDALVFYAPLLHGYSPEIDLIGHRDLTVTGATVTTHPPILFPSSGFAPTKSTPHFISGVTKDSAGAALGGCTVKLFRASTDVLAQTTTSDGSGNYSFTVTDTSTPYYIVAYKAGSPDVTGATVNTLVGV